MIERLDLTGYEHREGPLAALEDKVNELIDAFNGLLQRQSRYPS
jgi:hypothetical protein